ncbi:DUF6233 domain-containing protein [Streptomyces crystallinus]|uniref:DUF6233 domain-containing protein n=1 Tax=Streptomyces crystallinus TaxID=68191 RepID=UPI003CD0810B
MEHGLGGPHLPGAVHTGECWLLRHAGRMRAVDRDTARHTLAEGVYIFLLPMKTKEQTTATSPMTNQPAALPLMVRGTATINSSTPMM